MDMNYDISFGVYAINIGEDKKNLPFSYIEKTIGPYFIIPDAPFCRGYLNEHKI